MKPLNGSINEEHGCTIEFRVPIFAGEITDQSISDWKFPLKVFAAPWLVRRDSDTLLQVFDIHSLPEVERKIDKIDKTPSYVM